ncbi:MAG TPA: serine hydrolase domain-containing protein [Vicinamibacterales bacterium]|jgi:CubicO group peptidase (beta-lactamase class C family)|nr:serine hydrolase domain-containing protein [Vicinamibacterales bacterium]
MPRAAIFLLAIVLTLQLSPAAHQLPQTRAAGEVLAADTPRTTVEGNKFTAPAGWRIEVRGPATILTAPEGDSRIALVDVRAKDADTAVAAAWKAYRSDAKWPLKVANDYPDKDGWSNIRDYSYQTSPNEKRNVSANARRRGDIWTVVIYDMDQAVGEKRGGQVALIFGRLLPKGYERETFAGKTAHKLDAKRIAELSRFVESGIQTLGVPGASIGIVQDGKVVFAGGFGVREIGRAAKPDAETLYSIASNTKALTTLMLAKLLDEGKLMWETPVTSLLPSFKLGDEDVTSRVLVKHLICACTGLPRQDYEWLFEFKGMTPDGALKTLGTMKPTSKFGEMFQYSNPLAGAAGFVGGHVAYPKLELGAAYDEAMASRVFGPLGMTATTFDFPRALAANHAGAHAPDIHGKPARAVMEVNYAVIPVRPAGGAWSNVRDMLKYVQMELDEGVLPGGTRYIAKDTLLARRAPQVSIGQDVTYGMGLIVETTYGIPVVQHGGDLIGYHSNMLWLPEHNVGAVILTNADPGWVVRGLFDRKLLEVLFDGRPQADADLTAQAKSYFEQLAAERKLLTVPATQAEAAKLAARYTNDALGEIAVQRNRAATVFDFGEWKSEVASRKNPDGTISFLTITPGIFGLEFVVGSGPNPTLVVRDAQHEYVFSGRTQSSAR